MRILLYFIVALAWALWLGGLIALFVFVQTLFTNDRAVAVQAAPQLFLVFQKYHLILAAVALIATVGWRISTSSRAVLVLFILLAIAACCGVAVALWIIGPMEELRRNGLSSSPEFKRLHGRSMMLFVAQAAMLLAAGISLVFAMRDAGARTSPQTARE